MQPISISKIILPTRSQPDTIVAIFILKKLGTTLFPEIDKATVGIWQEVPGEETEQSLLDKGTLLIDVGGGTFDHHNKTPKTTASKLVSTYLGVDKEPELQKLLAYAERDDFFGKGTVSDDPLDRAFGLSALITNVSKDHPHDPNKAVNIFLPIILAHYNEEVRRTKEIPEEFEKIKARGEADIFTARQNDKNLRVVILHSNSPSMAGYLRSQNGGRFDVVTQVLASGHVNVLTRPTKRVELRAVAMIVRLEESAKRGREFEADENYLTGSGRIKEVPEWYFDRATNSLQNGGLNPKTIEPTKIPLEEFKNILMVGLSKTHWSVPSQVKPVYTALFVENVNSLIKVFPPKHQKVYGHHSTIAFKPPSLNGIEVGRKSLIKIVGRAYDEKGDALLIENSRSENKYPHITLSCAPDVSPIYSNQLIENAIASNRVEYFGTPEEVAVIEGYYDGKNDIVSLQ